MPKPSTGQELSLELGRVLDRLLEGTITPAEARRITRSGNAVLRDQLRAIKEARARGEKPDLPFFADEPAKSPAKPPRAARKS